MMVKEEPENAAPKAPPITYVLIKNGECHELNQSKKGLYIGDVTDRFDAETLKQKYYDIRDIEYSKVYDPPIEDKDQDAPKVKSYVGEDSFDRFENTIWLVGLIKDNSGESNVVSGLRIIQHEPGEEPGEAPDKKGLLHCEVHPTTGKRINKLLMPNLCNRKDVRDLRYAEIGGVVSSHEYRRPRTINEEPGLGTEIQQRAFTLFHNGALDKLINDPDHPLAFIAERTTRINLHPVVEAANRAFAAPDQEHGRTFCKVVPASAIQVKETNQSDDWRVITFLCRENFAIELGMSGVNTRPGNTFYNAVRPLRDMEKEEDRAKEELGEKPDLMGTKEFETTRRKFLESGIWPDNVIYKILRSKRAAPEPGKGLRT